jgi:hypothetical protein
MKALILFLVCWTAAGQEWRDALAKMPVKAKSIHVYQTEPVELVLKSFRPTAEMRGVVLMPAAADQIYFFDWGTVELPPEASLLDALNALEKQAQLRFTFVAPFLLIHLDRDTPSDPLSIQGDVSAKFAARKKKGKVYYLDRPYDQILPALEWVTRLPAEPDARSTASWHFYRLSFVGYDLSAPDYLRAMAYGTKTSVAVEPKRVVFKDRPFRQ